MARIYYTKTIEHYAFNPPQVISEEDFNILKMKIGMNPSAPLIDERSVESSHDKMTLLVVIGIFALIISIIGMMSSDSPPGWSMILLLISVFGVIHPLINGGVYESKKNELRADKQRIAYYRKLKSIVIQSPDYQSFKLNYRRSFTGQ